MAAHTRSRPRNGRSSRKRKSIWSGHRLLRPEVSVVIIGAIGIAALLWAVDVPSLLADVRDWLLGTFGLGLVIVAILSVAGGLAISRRAYEEKAHFARFAIGALALSFFAWGALGLNEAPWQVGGVDFREASLGGDIGRAIVSGVLGKLAWISLFIIAMPLLAPRATSAFARNAPVWVETAWERRWPHRVAGAIGAFFRFIFRRPGDDETVIGGTLRERLEAPAGGFEDAPIVYRPAVDPG